MASFSQIQPDEEPGEPSEEGIEEAEITLISGRTLRGELVRQTPETVVIGIDGIETTFQRRNIAEVKVLPPVSERYRQMRDTIADDDIDSRLSIVEWLRARKAYAIALEELRSILDIDPGNPRAKLLLTWLSEHEKLRQSENGDEDAENQEPSRQPDAAPNDSRAFSMKRNEFETLSQEQLNLMRVYEIDLRDPPRIRIPDEVITRLIERSPEAFSPNEDERRAVYGLPEIEKLKLLFRLKARDLYPKVEVLETPASLENFKNDVHHGGGWLINACSSTRCHGGAEAGSFRLLNTRPNSDATAFTNLYIIENTTLADGTPLIDFNAPERSPLLQMGMVPSNALNPHPEIPRNFPGTGYRPIFRTTRDRKYQQAIEWIRSMYQPRPDYEFEYAPLQPVPEPDANPDTSADPDTESETGSEAESP
ncbi:MAG: hypothetical protein WD114_02675 [Phycisphaerales bacterium]